MRSQVALVAVLALLVVSVAGTAPAGAQSGGDGSTPEVAIDVSVAADGDARWNVSTRFALETANETAAFERLRSEVENGGATSPGFSAETFEQLAAVASERTGREMRVQNVTQRAFRINHSDGDATGVVVLEFEWTAFADASGDSLVVGDAFVDEWRLTEGQRLTLSPPEDYAVSNVRPSASTAIDNGTVAWAGPQSFDGGEPHVSYVERADGTGTETSTRETSPGREGEQGPSDLVVGAGVVLVLALGGIAAFTLVRRTGGVGGGVDADDGDGSDGGAAGGGATAAQVDAGDGTDADADPGDTDAGAGESGPEPVDPDLLSDEERVERLLRANGGRMKQANIVEETGWSNAKVSQLLSSMDEDDRVEKLRIGRENLISLGDADPAGSRGNGEEKG